MGDLYDMLLLVQKENSRGINTVIFISRVPVPSWFFCKALKRILIEFLKNAL